MKIYSATYARHAFDSFPGSAFVLLFALRKLHPVHLCNMKKITRLIAVHSREIFSCALIFL